MSAIFSAAKVDTPPKPSDVDQTQSEQPVFEEQKRELAPNGRNEDEVNLLSSLLTKMKISSSKY